MKKNVKNKIINQILENTKITTTKDINNVLDDLYGNIIQRLLETEMDNHLGYDKNSKEVKETNNRRNGYSNLVKLTV
ncbi:MAG: transposase [Bacilli bacterium]|jgi:putative transposase